MKTLGIGVLALTAFAVIGGSLLLFQPDWLFYREEFRTGNRIISQVEAFRTSHGHLPETLNEAGYADPDPKVFYRKVDENKYLVWFGTTLGESETYDSLTRKWE